MSFALPCAPKLISSQHMTKDMLIGSRTGRNLSDQMSQDTSKDCTSAACGKRSLANAAR